MRPRPRPALPSLRPRTILAHNSSRGVSRDAESRVQLEWTEGRRGGCRSRFPDAGVERNAGLVESITGLEELDRLVVMAAYRPIEQNLHSAEVDCLPRRIAHPKPDAALAVAEIGRPTGLDLRFMGD